LGEKDEASLYYLLVKGKPEGALAPSETTIPLLLVKGKGIKGIGFPYK